MYLIVKKVIAEHCNQVLFKIIHRGKKKQRNLDGRWGHERGVRIEAVERIGEKMEMELGVRGSAARKQSISVEWVQHTFSREAVVVRTNFGKAAEHNNKNRTLFDILNLYLVGM